MGQILLGDMEKIKLVVRYAKSGSQDVLDLVDISIEAQLKKVAEYIENLPTDGWDKWHFYNRDLAKALLKEAVE